MAHNDRAREFEEREKQRKRGEKLIQREFGKKSEIEVE